MSTSLPNPSGVPCGLQLIKQPTTKQSPLGSLATRRLCVALLHQTAQRDPLSEGGRGYGTPVHSYGCEETLCIVEGGRGYGTPD